MFAVNDGERAFALKPMSCPGHIQIFNRRVRSWRELPVRLREFGACHRNEPSGALHGLMRTRAFVQDDAHIFCREDQIVDEVARFCRMLRVVYADFGFADYVVGFSTRPAVRAGSDALWDRAEAALAAAARAAGLDYRHQPGEGVFYGPKLEFILRDSRDARVAVRHHPARLRAARAARRALCRRGRAAEAAGDDPPCRARQRRAVHRHPARAPLRQPAAVAGARAGGGRAGRRPAGGLRQPRSPRRSSAAGCASRSMPATKASAAGCSTRASAASRSSRPSAPASCATAPSPSAGAAASRPSSCRGADPGSARAGGRAAAV